MEPKTQPGSDQPKSTFPANKRIAYPKKKETKKEETPSKEDAPVKKDTLTEEVKQSTTTATEEVKQSIAEGGAEDWKRKESWNWTHFFNVPLNIPEFKVQFDGFMDQVSQEFGDEYKDCFQGFVVMHLSLIQMKLNPGRLKKLMEIMPAVEEKILEKFKDQDKLIEFGKLGSFSMGKGASVLYLEVQNNKLIETLNTLTHELCQLLMKEDVIDETDLKTSHIKWSSKAKKYVMEKLHITLMKSTFARNYKGENKDLKPVLAKFKENPWKPIPIDRIDVSVRGEYSADKYYLPLKSIKL